MTSNSRTIVLALLLGTGMTLGLTRLAPGETLAYGGGLDSRSYHSDRQRGGYDSHQGPLAKRFSASAAKAVRALTELTATHAPSPALAQPVTQTSTAPPITAVAAVTVPYDRDLYRHWIDADGDCQDTRQEVLILESVVPVTLDAQGCRVVEGSWLDPFTGDGFTDPTSLEIDHLVPLAEVHRSGGHLWTAQMREQYANDLRHRDTLIAVSASANRSKGDRDPASWLPSNEGYRCTYVRSWILVKATYRLQFDPAERQTIANVLAGCA